MRSIIYIIIFFLLGQKNGLSNFILDTVPQTQNIGLVNTTWDDFMGASPTENIPVIKLPEASSSGDAQISFPIKLPEARKDFMPDINLSYANEGGTSWLGTGWDITLPSFTLDTRWGVPLFDNTFETEIYLYNGQQMGPVFHRAVQYEREIERVFHMRQETDFERIIRHGDSARNYWWEVKSKNGSVRYYGGTPSQGALNDYLLKTDEGNITEWFIVEAHDIYGNYINYKYQERSFLGSSSKMPFQIHYNGFDNLQGTYQVEFILKDRGNGIIRKDAVINYRTGRAYVVADLLESINVYHDENIIRSYKLDYQTGEFNKELLVAISEYDSKGDFFYKYDFDYHNNIRNTDGTLNLFASPQDWSVEKDNIDISPVSIASILPFVEKPTVLGGAKSWTLGAGLAVTVGIAGSPVSKENTVGVNGGGSTTNGTGLTSLIDINGDGLPDKVWKESGNLFFKENMLNAEIPINGFSPIKKSIQGINDFSISNTISWNIGGELNLGVGAVGGFVGYSRENTTTTVTTYFADFNGDELIDIAKDGRVYFNTIDADGIPTFTTQSSLTENPIIGPEPSNPLLNGNNATAQAEIEDQFPLNDVVRVWKAPVSGRIEILGDVRLVESCDATSAESINKDGVTVMIQQSSVEVWRQNIDADDFTPKTPQNVNNLFVSKNDSIFFRVHSKYNGFCDKVTWDPIIRYTDKNISQVNADCISHYEYRASTDYLLTNDNGNILPADGTIKLSGMMHKPCLSDSVRISITGAIQWDTILPPGEINENDFGVENIVVSAASSFNVTVSALSNVDWASISWKPFVEYTAFDNGNSVVDNNGNPLIRIFPNIDYAVFQDIIQFGQMYVAESSGVLQISTSLLGVPITSEFALSIKSKKRKDSLHFQEVIMPFNLLNIEINVVEGDTIFADVYSNSLLPIIWFDTPVFDVNFTMNGLSQMRQGGIYFKSNKCKYRGWDQFSYNANNGRGNTALDFSALKIDTSGLANDTLLIGENTDPEDIEGGTNSSADELFIVMRSDPESMAWQGSDPLTFLNKDCMSSSRKGKQDVDLSQSTGSGIGSVTTIDLITKSKSDAVALGASGSGPASSVGLGGGLTFAQTWSVSDLADMNGDRFPDYLIEDSIFYLRLRGSEATKEERNNWGIHHSGSFAGGGGIGGSYVGSGAKNSGASPGKGSNKKSNTLRSKVRAKLNAARHAFNTSRGSGGLSISLASDRDSTEHSFIDINGDGLEDKIWYDGRVALNKGYSFESARNWNFPSIRSGNSLDVGGGPLGGFNQVNGSIMGGLSGSRTNSSSDTGFTDLNDDALLDLIVSVDPLTVRFNTGYGFGDEIVINQLGEIDRGVALGESINGAFTICVNFLFFRVCFNPSTYFGQGSSSVNTSFADINGDGYVDYLSSDKDDSELQVRSSNIGNTNMLRTIYTPTGGEISLDYKPVGNIYDMPFSKWVLSEYSVFDGVEGDGVNSMASQFEYEDPFYNRHERQIYGFGKVIKKDINQNDEALRSISTEYLVDNYYEKGLRKRIDILDSDGNTMQSTEFEYSLKDIATGNDLPPSFRSRNDGMAFPALTRKIVSVKEGITNSSIDRIYTYEYDTIGNVIAETDFDAVGNELKVERTYKYDFEKYNVDKVESELIFGDGELFRNTQYNRDGFGNIIKLIEKIDASNVAITDMSYDEFGNLLTVLNPRNYKGERLSYEYKYDSLYNQYLVYELNGYGYEKMYTYEYEHNQITSSTDENRNKTSYIVDEKGRTETIIYPYEQNADLPYSVNFEFFPNAEVAYAVAHHYDPSHDEDLDVYNYEDGMFRQIQTKVGADLLEPNTGQSFIVSGTEFYDDLGRKVETYLPVVDASSNPSNFYNELDLVQPIKTNYDVIDRPIFSIDTYGGTLSNEYTIGSTNTGQRALITHQIDALGNLSSDYFNARGHIIAERFLGPQGEIWRNYIYDGFSQISEIIDHLGNTTTYKYDMLGRRISVKVPDAGETTLKYDNAGNLIERVTATIRDVVSTDGSIKYSYDKERLIQIDYPKYFQNKVQIHYGSAQDSFNRVGRIWLQEDGTGGREYYFDANGNPTKTIRTLMVNRTNLFTYVSENEYDTWGRIHKMKYPDGEVVSYQYNKGGQLMSMIGEKNDDVVNYINFLGYDKFGDRVYSEYGNGCTDKYKYDNKGRLEERMTTSTLGLINSEKYTYDLMDNLNSKVNSANAKNELGGSHSEFFQYDQLYRLINAEGSWVGNEKVEDYNLFMDYDDINNLTMKSQSHISNDQLQVFTSRTLDYIYEAEEQPTRPSEVGGKEVSYDKNGNLLLSTSNAVFDFDQNVFDEENRLIGTSNNGKINRFTYDAFGRRTIKSSDVSQGVFINGAPAGFVEHTVDFQVYVSPYFTTFENSYRKHYFIDGMRFLTKIGTGLFQTTLSRGPEITAGGIDYKFRIQQLENSILEYYANSGVAPGPPSLLALNAQPEINTNSLPEANSESDYNLPPINWPNLPPPDTMGPPGSPIFFDIQNFTNESVEAGYNFTSGDITKELIQFYYHNNNDASTHFITDFIGEPRQYNLYFPTGELWVSQTIGIDSTPYKYKALELDEDSGYYNYGNIYFNPKTNVELSIDPVLQNFGENTFLTRQEGTFYYDFAEDQIDEDDPEFDNEILNSERPDPFVKEAINGLGPLNDLVRSPPDILLRYKDVKEALGDKAPSWDVSVDNVNPDHFFADEIKQMIPVLLERDLSSPKEFKNLAKQVFKNHKWEAFKKQVKQFFKRNQKENMPMRIRTKRKVRIK